MQNAGATLGGGRLRSSAADYCAREHILARMKAPKTTETMQDILTVDEIGQIVNALIPC